MKVENIKFKAKRLDNGEWVKGDLAHSLDGGLNIFGFTRENGVDYYSGVHLIDPSTICQFTGLKDCKGNEVWEGDMLSNVTNDSPDGIVVFKYGAFCLLAKNGRDFCVALTYLLSEKDSLNRFKVIGNKFDGEVAYEKTNSIRRTRY